MRKASVTLLLLVWTFCLHGQVTFKSGWDTYKAGMIMHEYTYLTNIADSLKLNLTDSLEVFASPDSLVTMTLDFPLQDKSIYKTSNYLNSKKQIIKSEEYKDDNLQELNEWKYDDKNRKIYHLDDNKQTGNNFRKTYEYASDKKTGEFIVTESSYFNGKIEFYTKAYYNKDNLKLKEVRLNDNNKDIVHIESYTYGENGKVKERSVYFPEWKVTKKFEEREGNELPKCFKTLPVGTAEKIILANRIVFIKRLIARNRGLLCDKECHDYEYTFTNFSNCEIVVAPTNVNHMTKIIFRYKEKF